MKKGFTKEHFYALLESNGDCLDWTKATSWNGYGLTNVQGVSKRAHRLALELEGVNIKNKVVMHSCDNRRCCNPEHLIVGTQADNIKDKVNKNRHRITYSKLNTKKAIKIKEMLSEGHTQKAIAEKFGVSEARIWNISVGRTWKDV